MHHRTEAAKPHRSPNRKRQSLNPARLAPPTGMGALALAPVPCPNSHVSLASRTLLVVVPYVDAPIRLYPAISWPSLVPDQLATRHPDRSVELRRTRI
jgi:hypothetical protein